MIPKPDTDQAQIGVGVVAIAGKLDALDVFDSTPLFRQSWPKLLKSYALDAANAAEDEVAGKVDGWHTRPAIETCTIDDARRFLAAAQAANGKQSTNGEVTVTTASTDHLRTFSAQGSRRAMEGQ